MSDVKMSQITPVEVGVKQLNERMVTLALGENMAHLQSEHVDPRTVMFDDIAIRDALGITPRIVACTFVTVTRVATKRIVMRIVPWRYDARDRDCL